MYESRGQRLRHFARFQRAAYLDARPTRLSQLRDLSPDTRERSPNGLEVLQLLGNHGQTVDLGEVKTQSLKSYRDTLGQPVLSRREM